MHHQCPLSNLKISKRMHANPQTPPVHLTPPLFPHFSPNKLAVQINATRPTYRCVGVFDPPEIWVDGFSGSEYMCLLLSYSDAVRDFHASSLTKWKPSRLIRHSRCALMLGVPDRISEVVGWE